jgi:hypothetical protein
LSDLQKNQIEIFYNLRNIKKKKSKKVKVRKAHLRCYTFPPVPVHLVNSSGPSSRAPKPVIMAYSLVVMASSSSTMDPDYTSAILSSAGMLSYPCLSMAKAS